MHGLNGFIGFEKKQQHKKNHKQQDTHKLNGIMTIYQLCWEFQLIMMQNFFPPSLFCPHAPIHTGLT